MNCSGYFGRHPGKPQQCPVQLRPRPLAPLQLQRGIEDLPPVLVTDALTDQPLAGRGERPIVFVTQLKERRHMKCLRKSVPLVVACRALDPGREPVVGGLSESIVYLGHDQLQLVFAVVTVKERNWIEVVPQITKMSEQEDSPFRNRNAVSLRIPRNSLAQRSRRISEVVPLLVGNPVPPVVSRQRRHLHHLRQAVDIEKNHEQRVSKIVTDRTEPAMTQRSEIDSRFHQAAASLAASQATPRVSATRIAEFIPSSWNP